MSTLYKYHQPDFDHLELEPELEFPFGKRQTVNPLKTGDYVHGFSLEKNNINRQLAFKGAETHSSVVLRKLTGKPLVISFYSSQWKDHGLDHLRGLNQIQNEVKALGANILVITPDDIDQSLSELIWNHSLNLNFYYDKGHQIAKQFKVYAEEDPTWNRFPGIEVNVPLLATYLLDTSNHIIFDWVDQTLEDGIATDELFKTLHDRHLYTLNSKSA